MLVLTRKASEQVQIGDAITLTVVRIDGNRVRLGIEAPSDVVIVRSEIYQPAVASRDEALVPRNG